MRSVVVYELYVRAVVLLSIWDIVSWWHRVSCVVYRVLYSGKKQSFCDCKGNFVVLSLRQGVCAIAGEGCMGSEGKNEEVL